MKICRDCGLEKPDADYYKDSTTTSGLKLSCKKCYATRSKNYMARGGRQKANETRLKRQKSPENIEKDREKGRLYNCTFDGRVKGWRASAKKRDIEWNVSKEFLKTIPLRCFYTDQELTYEPNKKTTISIERKDSSKGYIEGNVVFCCAHINRMKQEFGMDYFLEMCGRVWLGTQVG